MVSVTAEIMKTAFLKAADIFAYNISELERFRVAARKSWAPAGEDNYHALIDTRKGIQPAPGRHGESAPGT